MIENQSNIPPETFQRHSDRIKHVEKSAEEKAEAKNIKNETEINIKAEREKLLKSLKRKQDEQAKINNRIKEYRVDLKMIKKDLDLINAKLDNLNLKEKLQKL